MTSNEKTQNYKVVDLVECYNFHIEVIFIRVRMKRYNFSKVRPCQSGRGGMTKIYCHAGKSGVTNLTCGICASRPLLSAPERANVARLTTPIHMA